MRKSLLLILVVGVAMATNASSWSRDFSFHTGTIDINSVTRGGRSFDLVTARQDPRSADLNLGVVDLLEAGRPTLPSWQFTLVVPQGMRIARVEVRPDRTTDLPGTYNLFPAQPPVIVSQPVLPRLVDHDPRVYDSDAAFPGRFAEFGPIGIKSGFRLQTVTLYPLQYRPRSGRLSLHLRVEMKVVFEPDPDARSEMLTERQRAVFAPAVRSLVINPNDVDRYAPATRHLDWGNIDCVIITSSALQDSFQPLVDWRNAIGYRTEIRTTAWIYSTYSGRDNQERIRNFIRDYYNNQGLAWVILGGDNAVVPSRRARAVVNSSPEDIPCDLYYVDLQWSWDGDNDNIFGEAGDDTVDLYYDLYVGRASVDNVTQVSTFVHKVLTHEKTPPTDYLRRILLVDALLWTGYNHRQSNDSIAAITPAGWTDVHFHDPINTTAVRDSLDHGFQFSHMVGHGNASGIYNGSTQYYGTSVANSHTNGNRVSLVNSIACISGNFEASDCLAEVAHNCATGGSIGVIMNSRFGWGQPPNMGPSEKLDIRFYDHFFTHDSLPIGQVHAGSKEVYRNSAISQQVWRWCYYELNFFGDPLLSMYRDVPTTLSMSYADPISTGNQNFTVTVTSGGAVDHALVCARKGAEVYARGHTSASGQVTLSINPTTIGYMHLTATRTGYLPDEDSCQVVVVAHDVGVDVINAPIGIVDSGAIVTPQARVRNFGSAAETNIPVIYRIGSVYADTVTIANLAGGDTSTVLFANWTAVPGVYATACTTRLPGDNNPANDRQTGTVTVRYRDIAAVAIDVPVLVDSGVVVTPVVAVANYGNTGETFTTRLRIPTAGYNQTRTHTMSPGPATDTLVFPNWHATIRGQHVLTCSTEIAGDMNPGNNRVLDTTHVGVHDVRVTQITSPAGTFDSAATRSVQARVHNNGNITESFPVVFSITGPSTWSDTAMVSNLAPGTERTVSFVNWTIGPRGSYSTACSTRLAGDVFNANDRATGSCLVRVHDAAAYSIVVPVGPVDTATTVPVRVVIGNNGSVAANIGVRVTIGWQYDQQRIISMNAGAVDTVTMPSWSVGMVRGNHTVTCSTWVSNDVDPGNNVVTGPVAIRVHDAAVLTIVAPVGLLDSGAVVTPQARVANRGTEPETFNVGYIISDGYSSSRNVALTPGRDTIISFDLWTAQQVGVFMTRCSTELAGDDQPDNNLQYSSVSVAGTDVAVIGIVSPPSGMGPDTVTAVARVANYSPFARSFNAWLNIFDEGNSVVFADSVDVLNLPSDSTRDIAFGLWPATSGRYTVRCSTACPGDANPVNDTASARVLVYSHDVGVDAILSPVGAMRPVPISPVARMVNYGEGAESFWAHMMIEDTVGGTVVYNDSVWVNDLGGGAQVNRSFPGWIANVGYYRLTGFTSLPGDVTPSNDSASARVVCTPGALGWDIMADLPWGLKPVKHGGCLTGIESDTARLYALKGYKTNTFYSYNVSTRNWTTLAEMPIGPSGRLVKKAADICSDGDRYLYALKGNKTLEFWRYDTREDNWEQMANLPVGSRKLKYGTGLAYVVHPNDSADIYCLRASKTREFYRYSVETNSWTRLGDAPAGPSGRDFKKGSALCNAGDGQLFGLKGRYNEFYLYDIATDNWTALDPLPRYGASGKRSKAKDGCDLTWDRSNTAYAFSGGNRSFFFAYVDTLARWVELESLPHGPSRRRVKHGGSLCWLGNRVWALKGNKTNEFWVYTPDSMALCGLRPRRDGVATDGTTRTGKPAFLVGPCPAHNELHLFAGATGAPAQVELLSPLGTVLAQRTVLPRSRSRFNVAELPAGTYFVRVTIDGLPTVRKVVISH